MNRKAVDAADVVRKENAHAERKLQLEQLTSEVMCNMAQGRIKHKGDFAILVTTDVDCLSHDIYSSPLQDIHTEVA